MSVPVAFDPEWPLVQQLCYFEGLHGATAVAVERGNPMVLQGGVTISTVEQPFGRGALYFGNPAAAQSAYPAGFSFSHVDQAFELIFFPTGFGGAGARYLFSVTNRLRCFINPATMSLVVEFQPMGGAVQIYAALIDPDDFIFRWNKIILRITTDRISAEINGVSLFDAEHGATSFSATSGSILSIGNLAGTGDNTTSFYGYIGPFRHTQGSRRVHETSTALVRFSALSSADPYRESVIFHSHCEPTADGLLLDEKGHSATSLGGTISTNSNYVTFGLGAALLEFPFRFGPSDDFILGDSDFSIEFRPASVLALNDGWAFSIVDPLGVVALAMRINNNSAQTHATVAGIDYTWAGSPGHKVAMHLVRKGRWLAIFEGNTRRLLVDVGTVEITGDGYLYIGKAPSISGSVNPSFFADEIRITKVARTDPETPTTTYSTERFSDYGPRSLSGHVKDAAENPVICTVRAYHLASGRLVSESVTDIDGSFSLPVQDPGEHFWTAHKPGKNALIVDRLTPVIIT